MKTFIAQIFTSVMLGYIVSASISAVFITPEKKSLEEQLNLSYAAVWEFQCNAEIGYMDNYPQDDLHYITCSYDDVKFIRAMFNSEAYANSTIVNELEKIKLIDECIQFFFTLVILLISLRAWVKGITSLYLLSENYADGKFNYRVKEVGPESIRSLIRNQHKMARSIDELVTKQKMIYTTLPHDIRTPLAAIQLTSDILVSHQGNNDFLLERLDTQVCSLNTLCESSLHLLKLLNKEVVRSKESSNFTDVLDLTIATFGGRKKFELFNCNQIICSDAKLLRVLFLNILSNAERYANETIRISFMSFPNQNVVRVNDDGKGFSPQIISAFNNGDIANILSKDGFGIGFVLIFELAKLLDGRVILDNHHSGGQVTIVMNR